MHIKLGRFGCPFAPWRPPDGRVFDRFSFDTETTDIDDDHPFLTPVYVLGAACDGHRGVFITREHVLPFFEAHAGVPFICHNAAFDIKVCNVLLNPNLDLYAAVEQHLVWDTLILHRLLSLATAGHTARGESGLADCVSAHLGISLDKGQEDSGGRRCAPASANFWASRPRVSPPST
jgi:hypothetical protein